MKKRVTKTKEQLLVDSVNREIREMRTDRMVDGSVRAFPADQMEVRAKDLPHAVHALFLEFASDNIRKMRTVREGDGETFNPSEEMEVSFAMGALEGGRVVWQMGIHDPGSPVNPSGHDFYAFDDGSFHGWSES